MKWIFLVILLFICSETFAFDDTSSLEEKIVVYSGEVEKLNCPIDGKYDCLTWPHNLLKFKFKDVCFSDSGYNCTYFCNGFIAIGTDKVPYFYAIERDRLTKSMITYYKCPNMF